MGDTAPDHLQRTTHPDPRPSPLATEGRQGNFWVALDMAKLSNDINWVDRNDATKRTT